MQMHMSMTPFAVGDSKFADCGELDLVRPNPRSVHHNNHTKCIYASHVTKAEEVTLENDITNNSLLNGTVNTSVSGKRKLNASNAIQHNNSLMENSNCQIEVAAASSTMMLLTVAKTKLSPFKSTPTVW